jgi:hypothetical protein
LDLNFFENLGQRDEGDVIMTFGEAGHVMLKQKGVLL